MRLARLLAAVLLAIGVLVAPSGPAAAVGETSFTNPLLSNGADPWLSYWNGNYYLATTTWNSQMVMRKSPTLAGLSTAAPVYVWSDTDADRCCNFWAPEFHRITGPNGTRWYLMYTAGQDGTLDHQRLRVLESAGDDPMGPYRFMGTPMPSTWNIDGTYLQHNGQLYLLYSQWVGADQSILIAQMSNPWTVTGSHTVISTPTYSWEVEGGRTNEAPVVLTRNGQTYVVYSASSCNTPNYKLGRLTLTGSNPLSASSWTKQATPVFQSANGVYGPGHNGFFTSPDGTQNWIVYHGNASSSDGCGSTRSTRAQQFTWNTDGTPNLGSPASTGTSLAVPSGELGPITAAVNGAAYTLVNRDSGLCLTVASNSTSDGGNVEQASCSQTSARWVLDPTADGYYRLVNSGSGKSLDAADCGTGDGVNVRQWAWLSNTCQQWQATPTTDGWFRLTNRNSGKVLDVANCGTAAGTNVQQWAWLSNTCQQWRLAPSGTYALAATQSGRVVDVANCATANGTGVRAWEWLASACQRWTFTHTDNGYYQLHPQSATGSCMVVAGGSTSDGAIVEQNACSGTAAQWRLEPLADGSVRLVTRHSGKALDLANCGLGNGTALNQWSWLDNICQRFHLLAG
ncbi:RICIN domain-containing protein [Micromonospora sp. CPCC 205371]|nr:RICIN domain-containing protein [Micromonospora sp. CPCC 205371]